MDAATGHVVSGVYMLLASALFLYVGVRGTFEKDWIRRSVLRGHRIRAEQDGTRYDEAKAHAEYDSWKHYLKVRAIGSLFLAPMAFLLGIIEFKESFILQEHLAPLLVLIAGTTLLVVVAYRNKRLGKLTHLSTALLFAGIAIYIGFILVYL